MRCRATQLAAGLVLLAAMTRPARADSDAPNPDLERARSEMAALQYETAQSLLQRALEHGSSDPAQLAEIYRMAGEVAAGLGQSARASEAFERLLALRPGFEMPEGTSPKIAAPFASAREAMRERGPLRARYQLHGGKPPSIEVVVVSDPLGMVSGARARYRTKDGVESSVRADGAERVELELPADKELDVIVAALDEYGNELVVHGSWEVPIRVPPPTIAVAGGGRPGPLPLYERWYLWGGAAVAFAAAGTYFGLAMQDAQSELDDLQELSRSGDEQISYDEAEAIEKRGRRDALLANVGFVAAGMAGALGTFLLIRELLRPDALPARTAVAPSVGSAYGVTVRVEF